MKHLIIGGSDAGISAALRIKELDASSEVHIFLADDFPNFSICGIPFYFSMEVNDWKTLAHRSSKEIQTKGIQVHSPQPISSIDAEKKIIRSNDQEFEYDKLLLATGAKPIVPDITGIHLPGVFSLRWIGDMLEIDDYITKTNVQKVPIIGGGYIGLEMADALTIRGLKVQVVEMLPRVMVTVDEAFARKVKENLEKHAVEVLTGTKIEKIEASDKKLSVFDSNRNELSADLVLIAVGAQPQNQLAKDLGLPLGMKGAIQTNKKMETVIHNIYAAGDCVETYHALLNKPDYLPLGTTAHKQGRVAGENMSGDTIEFRGSLGSQVVKIFDMVLGRTGLHDNDFEKYGLRHVTTETECWDLKVYYPDAKMLNLRITGNPKTGQLYGAQLIGHMNSEIAKRIDVFAAAIYNNMTVTDLNHLDLTYTPPLSCPWDPIQMAAQEWLKRVKNHNSYSA